MSFQKLLKAAGMIMLVMAAQFSFAQNRTVTGTVTDSKDGSPLQGVSVTAKGSRTGTQTDEKGMFTLSVGPDVSALIISSVGYATQEISIADVGQVTVNLLQTNSSLNEVVIIGYGTAKKKDLTGSVTQINSKDFQKGVITTPEQLIAGKVAGVSIISNGGAPGSGSTIRIRGGASLTASNDPLIVIDGVPISNDNIAGQANPLALINPNDIESFNILKDASATAIYGARASNGVILITTKKGKGGKPAFNFNSQLSFSHLAEKVEVLSPTRFREYVNLHGTPQQISLMGNAETDWQDEIYQTAITTDNNISMAGAIPHMPYRVSLGYLNQEGILRTGTLNRISAAINISPRLLNEHLRIDLNLKGSSSHSFFANEGAIGAAVFFDPTQPVRSDKARYGGYWEWLDPTSTTGLRSLAPRNPVGLLEQRDDKSEVLRSIGNMQMDYKLHFFPDLHVNLNLGYDISKGEGTIVVDDSASFTYKRDKDANDVLQSGVNNKYLQNKSNTLLEAFLNYIKDVKSINSRIDAVVGYSYQAFSTKNYNYPDFFYNGTKRKNSDPTFEFDKPEHRLISMYGRVNFNMKSKYLFTATVRRDGSSRFAPDFRWGWFPSAAFAWRIHDEDFLRNSKTFSDLKLRIGYGETGQQEGIGNYDYYSYYSLTNNSAQYQFGNTYYYGYRPSGFYQNRKWEETSTYNIGLDFGFVNNRITGSIDYYNKKTEDLLSLIAQPAGTNFSAEVVANIGEMENNGVELMVNTQPIRNQSLTWDFGFNVTYNKNEITNLTATDDPNFPGNQAGNISGGTGNKIQINSVGYNRLAFYVYQQVYDESGKPVEDVFVDQNKDGTINEKDLYRYKGPDPDLFFGINTNVLYKKWNAGFVMRGSIGNYMYNNIASSSGTSRNIFNPLNYLNNGSVDVLESGFVGGGSKYFLSDYYVQNASFLKLDNLYAGYNLGPVFNKKANLRLNANVQNVFVITKYKGIDPEISGGIDNNFYPRPRTFVIGINLDF
jgi:iron complex outermembrane receptor protein